MGGTGLANIAVRISVSDGQMEDVLLQQSLPWIPPGDSTLIEWEWHPRTGGTWELVARITGPVRDRDWGDMDSLLVDVSFAIRTRILSEAMPRPQTGASEWLELWNSKTGPEHAGSSWAGWKMCDVSRSVAGDRDSAGTLYDQNDRHRRHPRLLR